MPEQLANFPGALPIPGQRGEALRRHRLPPNDEAQEHSAAGSTVLARMSARWRQVELVLTTEDIRASKAWSIQQDRHAVIVHLGGVMHALETELDGFGASLDPASAGEVWIVPAGRHYASTACGRKIVYGVLHIPPRALIDLIGARASAEEIAPRLAHRDEFLYRSVERLAGIMGQSDDISEMLGETLSQALCLHLFREYRVARGGGMVARAPLLTPRAARQLQAYIHDHLADRLTLDALATLAGMSTHNLLIAFRKAFGTTPVQYVIAQRLRRVRWLLANTAKDITTIAVATGFASHSHLTTTFKRHAGLTPREFRRTCADPSGSEHVRTMDDIDGAGRGLPRDPAPRGSRLAGC